jgi:hypothetical protein
MQAMNMHELRQILNDAFEMSCRRASKWWLRRSIGRQTELKREFPLHVVCSWLGNSPRIAQQSYLLDTEDDFTKAAGVAKMMVEG